MLKGKLLIFLMLIPALLMAQGKGKRTNFFIGTAQGVSIKVKEERSNTHVKTFANTPAIGSSYQLGMSIASKSGKGFNDIALGYRSFGNGFKNAIDVNSPSGVSSKISFERVNSLGFEYRYSKYLKKGKKYNSFISGGIQASYILNRKVVLNYEKSQAKVVTKGKDISENFVLPTTPTFILSYGIEFDKSKFLPIGDKQRLSFDFNYDWYIFNLMASPVNSYMGLTVNYKVLF